MKPVILGKIKYVNYNSWFGQSYYAVILTTLILKKKKGL